MPCRDCLDYTRESHHEGFCNRDQCIVDADGSCSNHQGA